MNIPHIICFRFSREIKWNNMEYRYTWVWIYQTRFSSFFFCVRKIIFLYDILVYIYVFEENSNSNTQLTVLYIYDLILRSSRKVTFFLCVLYVYLENVIFRCNDDDVYIEVIPWKLIHMYRNWMCAIPSTAGIYTYIVCM